MNENFAERLIYQLFRSVIRASLTFGPVPWKRVKELLKMAAFDELSAQGYNKTNMSVLLDVAQGTVTTLSKIACNPKSRLETPSHTRVIMDQLFLGSGGKNQWDLLSLVYTALKGEDPDSTKAINDDSFNYRYELALALLLRKQLIQRSEQRAGTVYKLTPLGKRHLLKLLTQPVHEQADTLEDICTLCYFLQKVERPLTLQQIQNFIKVGHLSLSNDTVLEALEHCDQLQAEGEHSPIFTDWSGIEPFYSANPEARVAPKDPITEYQMAALGLVKRISAFTQWLNTEPDPGQIAMRSVSFRIREAEVETFLSRHRKQFFDALVEEESMAKNDTHALTFHMTWFGEVTHSPEN